jgi:hypothetical protein
MAIVGYFLRRESIPLLFSPGLSMFKARYATCAFPVETSNNTRVDIRLVYGDMQLNTALCRRRENIWGALSSDTAGKHREIILRPGVAIEISRWLSPSAATGAGQRRFFASRQGRRTCSD